MTGFAEFMRMRVNAAPDDFDFSSFDNIQIEPMRGPEFDTKAQELSDFVAGLNLDPSQNNRLIALMIDMVNIAEKYAMAQGVGMCIGNDEEHCGAFKGPALKS